MEGNLDEDPGWPITPRNYFLLLIPGLGYRRLKRDRGDGLRALRMVFVAFCNAIVLFGFVLIFVLPFCEQPTTSAILVASLALYFVVSQLVLRVRERPLDCLALANSYRKRFFVRIAVAEVGALIGFWAAFAVQGSVVYYASALLSLVGYRYAAPTRDSLQREQQTLYQQGCGASLVATLRGGPYTPMPEG